LSVDYMQFLDMLQAENQRRQQIKDRMYAILQLVNNDSKQVGNLPPELLIEYNNLKAVQAQNIVDPTFLAVAADLENNNLDPTLNPTVPVGTGSAEMTLAGTYPFDSGQGTPGFTLVADAVLVALYGIMTRDSHTDPGWSLDQKTPTTPNDVLVTPPFSITFANALAAARGEYTANRDLYTRVFPILIQEAATGHLDDGYGNLPSSDAGSVDPTLQSYKLDATQWAMVLYNLIQQGVRADDPLLTLKAQTALANAVGAGDNAPPSSISIDLPDLEQVADVQIQVANLEATQAIYFAAMLEELKIFNVVEKLVELFQLGMLPLGRGRAGDFLYNYWRQSVTRMTEVERRNLYARCFGLPGGDASQGNPNREFNDLWLRFISAVSSYARQVTVDSLLRASVPMPINTEQVRKNGWDLAANLSLHGYGVAYFAATELQKQLNDVVALLSDEDVKRAYGARDMWQVIDQVATLELGGARNSIKYRTQATAGAIVIRWLADHADVLSQPGRTDILDLAQIRSPLPLPKGVKVTTAPRDSDLVDACDRYLAVTGTSDASRDQWAQPVETPAIPTRPIQIPQIARDLLETVGVSTNGLAKS
jgi:hypothetical protein